MSAVPAVTSVTTRPADPGRIPIQTMDQDDFLKILVTQLTSQDPMSPKTDTDFIGQMATFSSLEQAKSMQADIARMREDQSILQANSLLGRTVIIQSEDGTTTGGLVTAVHVEAGTPKVAVGEGLYDLSQVTLITPAVIADN